MACFVRVCLLLMPGPELPARQLVDIWHVSCRHCPEACGAPAVHQGEVRHGMRQPLNRWQYSRTQCPNVLTTMAKYASSPQQMSFWLSPTDKIPDWIRKAASEHQVAYMRRCMQRYLSLLESVTQLLCDCPTDPTYTWNVTMSAAPVGLSQPDAEFEIGTDQCTPSQQLPKKCVCLTKTLLNHSQASLDAGESMRSFVPCAHKRHSAC